MADSRRRSTGFLGYRYLSDDCLRGFDKYKYHCIDTSPLSKYVMQPYWNAVVECVPRWVAPNLLTFTGWLMVMFNFALLTYFDPDYLTTYNTVGIVRPPIPRWVWLFCGVSHFVAYTLDGIDGKQARRTKSATPLGELFDHGLDSWAAILLPLSIYSGLGIGKPWGTNAVDGYPALLSVLLAFYFSHWEKYITGVMYLPWFYDFSQTAISIAYVVTAIFGVELWRFYILPGVPLTEFMRLFLIFSCIVSVPVSLYNIWQHYSSKESTGRQKAGLLEAVAPGYPIAIMSVLYYVWCVYSPNDIGNGPDVKVFFFSIGIVFSNINCRLIVSQMSSTKCERFNWLLVVLGVAMATSFLAPSFERPTLYIYFVVAFLAHVHYGTGVVMELCDHFNIHCFSLAKKPLKQN